MSRLIIVSNRLPITIARKGESLKLQTSVGGLTSGLETFHKSHSSLWVGWPGYVVGKREEEIKFIKKKLKASDCYPIFLSPYNVENYYHGFCNKIIWPLFHYFTQHVEYEDRYWQAYQRVNKHFCDILCRLIKPKDKIWIHDYHLMLLPNLLRKRKPDATIGFFLHIPFPSSDVFRLLPGRSDIIKGLLGADLIGFHTHDYVHHFVESTRRLLGHEYSLGNINTENRRIKVDAFPMGIDYERFNSAASKSIVQKELEKVRKKVGTQKVIISIDRLDYTKGLPERLLAYDLFLEKYPTYRKKVVLILVAVPSRTTVEHYAHLKRQVDEHISRINGKYGDIGWNPIWYLYRFLPFNKLVALYMIGDVALVTPTRDGMNLIAKEYLASRYDKQGVLILGEMAGAAKELGEALVVNPNNREEIADAIHNALTMSDDEQVRRNEIMQRRLQRYDIERWAHDFMERMHHVKTIQQNINISKINETLVKKIRSHYIKSRKRLLLLDYDGTLTSFTENPDHARPTKEIHTILSALSRDPKNEVVIVSGRNRKTLDQWFRTLSLSLIAEHGVWIKKKNTTWKLIESIDAQWKKRILPMLELYADRTPGSFIEEKEYSLVWHYRKADPKLALLRAGELKEALRHLTSNLDLGILEGSKVVEIKNTGINKGRAVLRWLKSQRWDFIFAIGDDWTDEDIFNALPRAAYSIKVGIGITEARYCVEDPLAVRNLLKKILR